MTLYWNDFEVHLYSQEKKVQLINTSNLFRPLRNIKTIFPNKKVGQLFKTNKFVKLTVN
jgi:hypothetical protein